MDNVYVQDMWILMIQVILLILESVETALKANGCKLKGKDISV